MVVNCKSLADYENRTMLLPPHHFHFAKEAMHQTISILLGTVGRVILVGPIASVLVRLLSLFIVQVVISPSLLPFKWSISADASVTKSPIIISLACSASIIVLIAITASWIVIADVIIAVAAAITIVIAAVRIVAVT